MNGYRDSGDEVMPDPPTLPQRMGIACLFLGAVLIFAYLAGQWGLIPKWIGSPISATLIVVAAGPLMGIGARRDPLNSDTRRKRLIIIAAGLAVCALSAAFAIYFKGA